MNEAERLAEVAAQMGHASIQTTATTYAHVTPGARSAPQTCYQVWCSLVQKKALTIERKGLFLLVPRDRIELPTRGFSVL